MRVSVKMIAFCEPGTTREVDVPDEEWDAAGTTRARLELAFHYGQNCCQPRQLPSVSVGDVVELDGHWLVKATGFGKLSDDELEEWVGLDAGKRAFHEMAWR